MTGRWASLLLALAPTAVGAQGLAYEGALGMASGEYIFTARTTSWTLSTGLSVRVGPLTFRAAAPLFLQNTTLLTGSGAGMMPSGGPSSGMVRDSGTSGGMMGGGGRRRLSMPASAVTGNRIVLGDPAVQLAWHVLDDATALTASVAAKIPATDTTAFGTGAWDVGGTLSFTRHFGADTFVGLDVAYWRLGDLPELDFRDPVLGTLSVGRALGPGWAGSLFVSGSTAALRGYEAPLSVGITAARLSSPGMWGVTGAIGLTETTPEVAVSLSWRVGVR
jgi:hypothetical protein